MSDDADPAHTRPRAGRPRDPRVDRAILEVTEELLTSEGYDALTIEAVAERAGVSRPTVYRRWPDKAHLVLAAVAAQEVFPTPVDTGDLRGDLDALVRQNAELFDSELFRRTVPALLARLSSDASLADAYVREFVEVRRLQIVEALERAVRRHEVQVPLDGDAIFDMLVGPLFYRAIVRRERLTADLVESLVGTVVERLTK